MIFSEPMVALGRIPDRVQAPFFHISPDVAGRFRWSGTTTLIFTPDPKKKLPNATEFTVTISDTAASVSGNRLPKPYSFSFTTPTIKLLRTQWYRKDGKADAPLILALRFNQKVDGAKVAQHLKLAYLPHDWEARPSPSPDERGWKRTILPQSPHSIRRLPPPKRPLRLPIAVFVFLAEESG